MNEVAIVGIGATPYYRRGQSLPRTITSLVGEAVLAACVDAGLSVKDVDGMALFSMAGVAYGQPIDPGSVMQTLGMEELTFTATLTGGGGGSAGAIGLARAAIVAGDARCVVSVIALQQASVRLGQIGSTKDATPESSFLKPAGLSGPAQLMAMVTRRHMHAYGTTRDAFAEIAISQRNNALNRPKAIMRTPLTRDDYFAGRMIADPLCLFDCCLETDGAVAVITMAADRAKDTRHKPVPVVAAAHGGTREWGRGFFWFGMPSDEIFASSGHAAVAKNLYGRAGVEPGDIDVALLYDHFSSMVLMQLEDYGFCAKGEGNDFVLSGAIRYGTGSLPLNTHGGQLSEAYILGMTQILEGVEQMRGEAVNQVAGAELALVTGGPSPVPSSGLILGKAHAS